MTMSEWKFCLRDLVIITIVAVCFASCLHGRDQNELKTAKHKTSDQNQEKTIEKSSTMSLASPPNFGHDARIVHDVTAFRFNRVFEERDQIWALMHITPGSSSGGGSSIGGDAFIGINGSWKLVAALTKVFGRKSGRYEWEEPFNLWLRKITIRDLYTIFRQGEGGSVICRYDPKTKDAGQFTSVCLVPRQWERYVKLALTYLQKNLERLQQESPKVTDDLKVLLGHENPFVAVTACNLLAERNGIDRDFVRGPLSGSKGYRQAIFTYLLLTHPLRMNQVELFEEMGRVVELADNSEQLAGAALGIFASFYSGQPESRSERESKRKLLEKLDKKQLEFGRRTESDKYIISILEMMRIRQEASVPTTKKEKATRKK